MVYVPPVTQKGLQDRIEKALVEDYNQEKLLNMIKRDKKLSLIWNMAIEMSYAYMGGKQLTKKGDKI